MTMNAEEILRRGLRRSAADRGGTRCNRTSHGRTRRHADFGAVMRVRRRNAVQSAKYRELAAAVADLLAGRMPEFGISCGGPLAAAAGAILSR